METKSPQNCAGAMEVNNSKELKALSLSFELLNVYELEYSFCFRACLIDEFVEFMYENFQILFPL